MSQFTAIGVFLVQFHCFVHGRLPSGMLSTELQHRSEINLYQAKYYFNQFKHLHVRSFE